DAQRLTYEDRAVIPGGRFAYRLSYMDGGRPAHSAETWIDVPTGATLSLQGLRPNPAQGALSVAFSLPSAAPATLELLDLGGRRMATRDVGSLGPGRQVLRL